MRKDIEIPKVENIHIIAVREWDTDFLAQNWNIYLINNREDIIETVLVLSRGSNKDQKTSTLRHGLKDIAPKTSAKVELITDEVLGFTNEYLVTFFAEGKLFERRFIFEPNSISEINAKLLPVMEKDGVYAS